MASRERPVHMVQNITRKMEDIACLSWATGAKRAESDQRAGERGFSPGEEVRPTARLIWRPNVPLWFSGHSPITIPGFHWPKRESHCNRSQNRPTRYFSARPTHFASLACLRELNCLILARGECVECITQYKQYRGRSCSTEPSEQRNGLRPSGASPLGPSPVESNRVGSIVRT